MEIEIPKDVVNPKAYIKWVVLKKNPILTNTIIFTSDGEEIDIRHLYHRLREKIKHLSPKEQEYILELKQRWTGINTRANIQKAMAYGRAGRNAGITPEKKVSLTPFEQDILELLGKMFTVQETVQILNEEYHIQATEEDVTTVLRKHIVEIERRREEFRNKVADVRLFNKRPRLDELAWMYSKMKARYIALNSTEAFNALIRVLEQIRKESEGDVINFKGALDVNIEVQIQNQIQREILKTINLKEIILGRVAARMNYDLGKLIAGLHNSYYSKFVSISGDFDPNAEMHHPSTMMYDFDRIQRESEQTTIDVKAEDVTPKEKSNADNIKAMFLSKIKAQKEEVERRQSGVLVNEELKRSERAEEVGRETPIKRSKKAGGKWDKQIPSVKKGRTKKFYKKEEDD